MVVGASARNSRSIAVVNDSVAAGFGSVAAKTRSAARVDAASVHGKRGSEPANAGIASRIDASASVIEPTAAVGRVGVDPIGSTTPVIDGIAVRECGSSGRVDNIRDGNDGIVLFLGKSLNVNDATSVRIDSAVSGFFITVVDTDAGAGKAEKSVIIAHRRVAGDESAATVIDRVATNPRSTAAVGAVRAAVGIDVASEDSEIVSNRS